MPKQKIIYSYVVPGTKKIRFTNDPLRGVSEEDDAPSTKARVAYCYDFSPPYGEPNFTNVDPSCHSKAGGQKRLDRLQDAVFEPTTPVDWREQCDDLTYRWLVGDL